VIDATATRVAHVMLDIGARSETFVANAVEAAEREGWESHVIGLVSHGEFGAVPAERVHCTGTGTLRERAKSRLPGRGPEWRFAEQAVGVARARRIGLVHAHFGWSANYAAPLAEWLGVPLVVTFYGTDATVPQPRRGRAAADRPYADAFRQASRVIAVSDYVERRLRGLGYAGPVDLIRNGLRLERLKPRVDVPPVDGGLRLLYVGRLIEVKGADVMLRAMPRILEAQPTVRLELIGDGPERRFLERLASDLRLGDAVSFLGARGHEEVLETMRAAHVLVVPGRTMPSGQAETSSMVFKEALALGVPVVSTTSGALPETCPPAFRAELARAGDPVSLAHAVLRILDDPAAWPARAEEGRRWMADQFDSAQLGEALSRCYAAALREPATVLV
jgi:glycosyltransferase involved in cell wall biosynthesis